LIEVVLSIGINQTLQQYGKSDKLEQDDNQHNDALRQSNNKKHK
jgi:hypothetical protein